MSDNRFPRRRTCALLLPVLLVALLPACAGAMSASLADSIARLIPDGAVTVDILTPQYTPGMERIANKIEAARQANPRFFQEWIARHPGGPLPWNPVFGVTRAEYDDYLRDGRVAQYVVSSRMRLTFQRDGRLRRWTIHGWGKLGPLEGVVLDLGQALVTSPRAGRLPFLRASAPDQANAPLKWRWFAEWGAQHTVGDPPKGGQALQAKLSIGPLDDGRTTGMYWVMRRFNGGRKLVDEFLLVRFQPAGAVPAATPRR